LLRLPLAQSSRYRTTLAAKSVAPTVADLHGVIQDMSYYLVGEMPREPLRTMIPETDMPFLIHDVDTSRQVFDQMPEQVRTIEKVMKHDFAPSSSSIGSEGGELQVHRCKGPVRHAS
jgi:hypothetical protein